MSEFSAAELLEQMDAAVLGGMYSHSASVLYRGEAGAGLTALECRTPALEAMAAEEGGDDFFAGAMSHCSWLLGELGSEIRTAEDMGRMVSVWLKEFGVSPWASLSDAEIAARSWAEVGGLTAAECRRPILLMLEEATSRDAAMVSLAVRVLAGVEDATLRSAEDMGRNLGVWLKELGNGAWGQLSDDELGRRTWSPTPRAPRQAVQARHRRVVRQRLEAAGTEARGKHMKPRGLVAVYSEAQKGNANRRTRAAKCQIASAFGIPEKQ